MYYDFCPHCGQSLEVDQVPGRMLVCPHCSKDIGFVGAVNRQVSGETEARIRAGTAATCPICAQTVDLKNSKTLVPHYGSGPARKICPGSGKPITPTAPVADAPVSPKPGGKDLSKWMTRDVIKVLFAPRNAEPRIEVLTLEYLDKSERVRIQIEALRDMLGHGFQMRDYPAALSKPHLAVWASAEATVVAKRHERGGFESIADADVLPVLADLRQNSPLFV